MELIEYYQVEPDIFLSSTIIDEVKQWCQSSSRSAVSYFYFSFSDPQKQKTSHLIRSLLRQFSDQYESFPEFLATLYHQCKDREQQPTPEHLLAALRRSIEDFDHVYIVIDALDECIEQERLLSFVLEIVGWNLDNMHILATSRKERRIEDCFSQMAVVHIPLDSDEVDGDIQTHVHARLCDDKRFKKWTLLERMEIETTLVQGAHGM